MIIYGEKSPCWLQLSGGKIWDEIWKTATDQLRTERWGMRHVYGWEVMMMSRWWWWLAHSPICACMLNRFSRVWLFVTLRTVARQAPLSMGFSRQEYWSGLPCTSRGDLLNLGVKPASLVSPTLAGRFFTTSTTWETTHSHMICKTIL